MENKTVTPVGRFAPAPTGALHTGSLVAAVGSYLMAKHTGGRWLLRLDDLDKQRQIPGMADDIMRTLEIFGLCWDGEVSRQSRHLHEYQQLFSELQNSGVVYPCCCSRREIAQAASAPHPDDDCIPYSGACRSGIKGDSPIRSWRLRVSDAELCCVDLRRGRFCQRLSEVCGDFVLRRGDGEFAYQLAVVVDDHITGVNQVVRGEDLLSSTPRQVYLHNLIGFPTPDYCHLPLVAAPDGSKLSKRDNLVSQQLGNVVGRERLLLVEVLRFLGQNPPSELVENSCRDILQWGIAHFKLQKLPGHGGKLEI